MNHLLPGSDPLPTGGDLASGLGRLTDLQNTAESDDLFNKLIVNLNSNGALQNESIKQKFKLYLNMAPYLAHPVEHHTHMEIGMKLSM